MMDWIPIKEKEPPIIVRTIGPTKSGLPHSSESDVNHGERRFVLIKEHIGKNTGLR